MNSSKALLRKRVSEFLEYHRNGDGECNGVLLKAYADYKGLGKNDRFFLALTYAITYSIPSACKMLFDKEDIYTDPVLYSVNNKDKLIFQSDRRYMRCNRLFEKTLSWLVGAGDLMKEFEDKCCNNRCVEMESALNAVQKWVSFGRFASFLFIETVSYLLDYQCINAPFDWKNGDTATSGMMNLFGYDNEADFFDKYDKLPPNINEKQLDGFLSKLLDSIKASGGDDNIACVETSLCAYRKFHKGTRYNGYYLDRQLEEIYWHKERGIHSSLCDELLKLRSKLFDRKYLGEVNGWKGVRKNMKRLYIETGEIR